MKDLGQLLPKKRYDEIVPNPEDWPVMRMSRKRKAFVEEVIQKATQRIQNNSHAVEALIDEIEFTMYAEKNRIKNNPWKVDPEDESPFWDNVKAELLNIAKAPEAQKEPMALALLKSIVGRYAEEIAGNFKRSRYKVARSIVTFFFSRLLNASRMKKLRARITGKLTLQDKIHITGQVDQLRQLAKNGTVVMVPTHFSNIDSVLVGWIIHILGLPAFIYGAGLNLFNLRIFAYFMNSLGAYKVDRRKKNPIYLETLKTYSIEAIKDRCHSLFFPGGTRSRSGQIETGLKLGLLGTAIEAQRQLYMKNPDNELNKIFIVPVVLNYHFVLEAPTLIREYLKQQGQERYYTESDRYTTSYKLFRFMVQFFTKGSDISLSIGKAMDLFGNYVDNEGRSFDTAGRPIDTREYFMSNGQINHNQQREDEYTRMLAKHIVKEYYKNNRVFSSHLVAFTAFEMFFRRHRQLDLYDFLRLPAEDQVLPYEAFKEQVAKLQNILFDWYDQGKLKLALHMGKSVDEVIEHGLANVGMYHTLRPLKRTNKDQIVSQDLVNLYYYHNRLMGYGLEQHIG